MENPFSEINYYYDWEIIHNPSPSSPSSPDGKVVIRSDHFSLDPDHNYAPATSPNDAAATPTTDTDKISITSGSEEGDDGDSCSSSVVGRNNNQGFTETAHQFPKPEEIVQSNESEDGVNDGEEKKRVVAAVWWKVPMEVLKYCVVKVSPVWGISMAAAALMGFVLLRRRYFNTIKRKCTGVQLNAAVDNDKKVSQLLSSAARLNEAFSVVKRIPIIRPALPLLPAPGMTSWQ